MVVLDMTKDVRYLIVIIFAAKPGKHRILFTGCPHTFALYKLPPAACPRCAY